ncbi:hypothetical protein B0H14DRAFT_3100584 [Mycena olivaceomarginata]|nr:hypothetical protein B0H14DRAFT_3100584 [Mycena olivaceomarginata]
MSGLFSAIPGSPQWPPTIPETRSEPKSQPPVVDSALSLELRLRWLEAILLGVKQEFGSGETLLRSAEDVQKRLIGIVNSNDGLKRFMDHCPCISFHLLLSFMKMCADDQHAHLLTPDYAVAEAPKYESMSASELETFLVEMEPDIRAAERDMQEIEALEKKGPRLDALLKAHREDLDLVASLEKRVARLMEGHATQVDALSELFVAWDDTVMDAEDKILRLERDRLERQRLGFE